MAIILCIKDRGENGDKTCPSLGKCVEQTKYGCPKAVLSEEQKLKKAEAEVIRLRTLLEMKKEGIPVPETKPAKEKISTFSQPPKVTPSVKDKRTKTK